MTNEARLSSRDKADIFEAKYDRYMDSIRLKGQDTEAFTGEAFNCRNTPAHLSFKGKYREERIIYDNLEDYAEFVPERIRILIALQKVYAIAVFDDTEDSPDPFGIFAVSKKDDCFFLRFFSVLKDDAAVSKKSDFLQYCISRIKNGDTEELTGLCAKLYEHELKDCEEVLSSAGMEVRRERDNIYEFSLSQVGYRDILKKSMAGISVKSLEDASEGEIDSAIDRMITDERAFPIPSYIDLRNCDLKISCICFCDNKPCGLLVVLETGEYLTVSYVWNGMPQALAPMISHALFSAEEIFTPEKKVLVPVVVAKTGEIIEKMVLDYDREEVLEAGIWF